MPRWLEVVLSFAMVWGSIEFVAWCVRDSFADVAYWKEHGRDRE